MMIPCECKGTVCICETTTSSPDWRGTATDLPTECNKEGHHVHANICQCKLKQIHEIADMALKSKIVVELYPRNHGKTLARTRYDALLEIRGLARE